MNGLLIKDFKLLKMQKNYFLVIVAISVGMTAFYNNVSFAIGFLTFVVSLFTLSTISYDEFDNGNAFLFSLPITRTTYTIEKYCFGLITGCSAWIFSVCIVLIANIFKKALPVPEIMMIASADFILILIVQALMLPFQLKFGGEKGRIAIIAVVCALTIIVIQAVKILNVDIAAVINSLSTLGIGMLIGIAVSAAAALFLISLIISIAIVNKKEF